MTSEKQHSGGNLSLIIAEASGRNVLLSGTQRACDSLVCRTDINIPQPDIICVDPIPSDIQTVIGGVPPGTLVVACIEALSDIGGAIAIGETINAAGAKFAIAEQSVGSPPSVFSAGQILSLVDCGATAVFREYDFIAEDTILQLLLEHVKKSKVKATLIGEPANRVKSLLEEVKLEWNDPDTVIVFRPEITFGVACALTQVPKLDSSLNTREKIAYELNRQGWFPYNVDDTRKAVGSLTRAWDLHTRTLHMLPQEAKRRGFPHPDDADAIFRFIENIETDERVYTSASGTQFNILNISEI